MKPTAFTSAAAENTGNKFYVLEDMDDVILQLKWICHLEMEGFEVVF